MNKSGGGELNARTLDPCSMFMVLISDGNLDHFTLVSQRKVFFKKNILIFLLLPFYFLKASNYPTLHASTSF